MKLELCFSGCGGLYSYFLGIAEIIQKTFDLHDVVFTGTSGGCFPCLLLSLEHDIEEAHREWNHQLVGQVKSKILGPWFSLNKYIRRHTELFLPDNISKLNGRLYCRLTKTPQLFKPSTWEPHVISHWENKQDLVDCILASCFIPVFDTKLSQKYQGEYYIDGGAGDHQWIAHHDRSSFVITPNIWRQMKSSWFFCISNNQWIDQLYEWGREDALEHLDELTDFFGENRRLDYIEMETIASEEKNEIGACRPLYADICSIG